MNTIKEFQQVRDWAEERGLYAKGDVKTQYIKLCEEAGEVARAIIKKDDKEFKDGLGDMVVVLVNLAHIYGTSLEECLALAYAEIKNRTGSMQNGSFVKDEAKNLKTKDWTDTVQSEVADFFKRKCLDDYQFNKNNDGYLGFINMNPKDFDNDDYNVCLFIINERELAESTANTLGLTINIANSEELVICEVKPKEEYYKCIGLKENRAKSWSKLFEISKTYLKSDSMLDGKVLLLKSSIDCLYDTYVDADQFELVKS